MRKLICLVLFLGVIGAGVGYFRGWYEVSRDAGPSKTNVNISFDKERIREDTHQAAEVAREIGDNIGQKLRDR